MTFLAAIAGLAGTIWAAVFAIRGSLLTGCLVVLAAAVCFSHPFLSFDLGPIPLTIDRLLLGGLVGAYVLHRTLGRTDPKPLARADIILFALVAVLAFNTFAHDWQADRYQPLMRLALYYLLPLAVYWLARQAKSTQRSTLEGFGALATFGLYLSLTAIAENRQWWPLVFPAYIASPSFIEFYGRARGPLLNPVGTGILLTVCLAATWMMWPRLARAGRFGLAAFSAVSLAAIYCTLTRSVWMGAALALAIVLGMSVPRSWRFPLLGGAALSAVLVMATQWERLVSFQRDKNLTAYETADSARLRPILATVAWKMFLDRPLQGCGFGQYGREAIPYFGDRSTDLPLERARGFVQHNVFLALLTETGLIGAGLFALLLWTWARDAWILARSPVAPDWARRQGILFLALAAAYFVNGMFHDVSIIPAVNLVLFHGAGLTQGMQQLAQAASAGHATHNRNLDRRALAAAAVG